MRLQKNALSCMKIRHTYTVPAMCIFWHLNTVRHTCRNPCKCIMCMSHTHAYIIWYMHHWPGLVPVHIYYDMHSSYRLCSTYIYVYKQLYIINVDMLSLIISMYIYHIAGFFMAVNFHFLKGLIF